MIYIYMCVCCAIGKLELRGTGTGFYPNINIRYYLMSPMGYSAPQTSIYRRTHEEVFFVTQPTNNR